MQITEKRRALWRCYAQHLASLEQEGFISLPLLEDSTGHNGHIFFFFTRTASERVELVNHFMASGVTALSHYVPLHAAPYGRELGNSFGDLPVTEALSSRILRLPLYDEMSLEQVNFVCDCVDRFFEDT